MDDRAYTAVIERAEDSGIGYRKKPVYEFFKRCFDILAGLLCFTVGLPVMLAIALAIVIDDPGNPVFVQKRAGLDGKEFNVYKWRTMYCDAEERKKELMAQNEYNDVHFKIEHDPRITRVGAFLRKFSLDETMQAVNLLNGTMSVIGPRPFVLSEQAQLPADRLLVKPGLSCYWQITDTAKMSYDEQLELDYKYIRERSVATDLKLIWETILVVFRGKNQ